MVVPECCIQGVGYIGVAEFVYVLEAFWFQNSTLVFLPFPWGIRVSLLIITLSLLFRGRLGQPKIVILIFLNLVFCLSQWGCHFYLNEFFNFYFYICIICYIKFWCRYMWILLLSWIIDLPFRSLRRCCVQKSRLKCWFFFFLIGQRT